MKKKANAEHRSSDEKLYFRTINFHASERSNFSFLLSLFASFSKFCISPTKLMEG